MDKERLVRDIYHKGVILCKPETPLLEVVRVMADTEIHAVMVAEREGEPPVGVVSHTDAIAHYGEDLMSIQARDVMTVNVINAMSVNSEATANDPGMLYSWNSFSIRSGIVSVSPAMWPETT